MCPKNLRTRLRPVNVCCAIVASHLVAPSREAKLPEHDCRRPRGESPRSGGWIAGCGPESVLQTFKTQNDARGADAHPPVRSISSRTAIARKFLLSQRLARETPPLPPTCRLFVLPSRYGIGPAKIRGGNPRIPTLSRVRRIPGLSVA